MCYKCYPVDLENDNIFTRLFFFDSKKQFWRKKDRSHFVWSQVAVIIEKKYSFTATGILVCLKVAAMKEKSVNFFYWEIKNAKKDCLKNDNFKTNKDWWKKFLVSFWSLQISENHLCSYQETCNKE